MILSNLFKKAFITESQQEFPRTIALVGGSFKPPHAGHWYMVEQYAKKADEVVVLISDPKSAKSMRKTSAGTVITAQMAKDIFDIYIKRYGLSNKVKAIVSSEPSPITAMFKYVDDNLKDVDVIFGVSKKDDDLKRFSNVQKYADELHNKNNVNILDPSTTAVEPYEANGKPISATDIRANLDKPNVVKPMLPAKLSDADVKKVLEILSTGKKVESVESVFEEDAVCIEADITDDLLKNAKIACYDSNVVLKDEDGKAVPVNPKKFPDRAVNICIDVNGVPVYIFFDAKKKCWDSSFKMNDDTIGALSPNQFGQFFNTQFCNKLFAKLQKIWPLTDPYHADLYNAAIQKRHALGCPCTVDEAADDKEDEEKEKPKFTASGRKIMKFNDSGVSSEGAKFFCWPNTDKVYRWSTWKDWKKIRPLCRMRFKYKDGHTYGITLSTIGDDYKNRGFRSYAIDIPPPLQWLSKDENASLMKLSLFDKFIRHCVEKIQKYVNLDPEEIYAKINNPEKITVDEIRLTQQKIRNTLNQIIKNKQSDSFKWYNSK